MKSIDLSPEGKLIAHDIAPAQCRKWQLVYRVTTRGVITFGPRRLSGSRSVAVPARGLRVTAKGRAYLKELESENAKR